MPTLMRLHVHLNASEAVGPTESEAFRARVRTHIRDGRLGGVVLVQVLDHIGPPDFNARPVPMAVSVVEERPAVDYQALLQKYMQHVSDCEGTTFVRTARHSDVVFTPAEEQALLDMDEVVT